MNSEYKKSIQIRVNSENEINIIQNNIYDQLKDNDEYNKGNILITMGVICSPLHSFEMSIEMYKDILDIPKIVFTLPDAENKELEERALVIISTETSEEEVAVGESIHNQLSGNQDYINNNIVLNLSKDREDDTENEVHLYIFKEATKIPSILL